MFGLAGPGATVHFADQSSFVRSSSRRVYSISADAAPAVAGLVDAIGLGLAGFAGNIVYHLLLSGQVDPLDGSPRLRFLGATIYCLLAKTQGLYQLQSIINCGAQASRIARIFAVSVLMLTCLLFLLKIGADYSRGGVVVFAVFGLCTLLLGRRALGGVLELAAERGLMQGRPVVTVGDRVEMERLSCSDLQHFGIDEIGRVALSERRRDAGLDDGLATADQVRLAHAIEIARLRNAREFALVLPWGRDRALSEVLGRLRASPLPVRLYPDHKVRDILGREQGQALDPHFSVLVQRAPLSGYESAVKRMFDLVVAASLLLLLAPLLAVTALAIKLDSPGPVIFRQRRGGFDNREFMIFKFRTMTVLEDAGVIAQARREDPRVTRVGRALRRTSIDELPQLLNVLRGEMSLVGPRPHAVAHDEVYQGQIANYALRNHVKPGLTGAAQVVGLRGETRETQDMARRVEQDIWYINNWSLTLDLRLLAQTALTLLRSEAYSGSNSLTVRCRRGGAAVKKGVERPQPARVLAPAALIIERRFQDLRRATLAASHEPASSGAQSCETALRLGKSR